MRAARHLFARELSLAWGGGGGPLLACAFLACLTGVLPLAAGPDPDRLKAVASGMVWLILALTTLLSLERLFERDLEDGSLDLLALGPLPLEAVFAIKALAQWTAASLPLAIAAPIAAIALGAPAALAPLTVLIALLGGLAFAFTGAPLFIPPVIFGSGALARAADGADPAQALILLGAYALFALALSPLAGAAAIRNAQG